MVGLLLYDHSHPQYYPRHHKLKHIYSLPTVALWVQHCSSGDTLLGQAPVWLSCIILFVLGGIVGATGGIVGMVFRHRKLQKEKHRVIESLYGGPYQTASSQVPSCRFCSRLLHCCQIEAVDFSLLQSITSHNMLCRPRIVSTRQYVNKSPMGQRLLQEDAIRQSGVSGPLGMGVVMQSKC